MNKANICSFTDLNLHTKEELRTILDYSSIIKKKPNQYSKHLLNKNIALIFLQPSTRTRISFEVGINQLGGNAIILNEKDTQLTRGESIYDTAKVLSRYVDLIVIRILEHNSLLELDKHSTVPVINSLTQHSHPCQVLADIMTYEEKTGPIENATVSWIGDFNNMLVSWIHAATVLNFKLNISTLEYSKNLDLLLKSAQEKGNNITYDANPHNIISDADIITTDSWISMGYENNIKTEFFKYQVNAKLLEKAKPNYMFLHCLPAHRGEEVTSEIIDGPNSYIFDEAENRLHIQKAIMLWCLNLL
ncbi:ornithine carbamoyltransferase [Ehrlichia chaffeensis str. Heartland]|uniref:Ornithine carbamoyltransferase n=1 Tax=Ehrlichia chaffeensis (strain ATCC CRL-10679 / Arkansas) TaxID=205920 RepID=Q2GI26_EHRCR|nr:ornithine carbamoyltransferase [Ehrlichia chaffeensis]ABD45030.1 ornithine carbamoyltransferase [Ehrlichia chaffeensis str. Arkansas]AHX04109.1 ornithine carbamoyltransferase [Ehrlichia chaffeensis str. Heartland]AHX06045.1 ornithine carbamoyltransferase [Ehrlichia chaffeensis str. Jax]AHX07035.1 ornithine carbamoyltransferase [Ehrlichia chaffeensis str. Liberty]AHX07735.1 ornithine carbamoyltransferase [Ehrlichia chaffeensis str. Osceola]